MSENENIFIVIAEFKNHSASVGALAGLEHWADTRKDIKLGAVGALRKEEGEISAEIVRKEGKGILVRGAMGLARSLLGPLALVGDVAGGLANAVFKKPDEGSPEALQELSKLMDAGSVALLMICSAGQEDAYREQLETMCGNVLLFEVPRELLDQAAAAVEEAEAEAEAEKKAQKEAEKEAKKQEKKER
jgi:hypothetical protein